MQQRKISISEWPEVLSRYQDSGLSQKAFCLREGLSLHSFLYHCYRRTKRAQPTKTLPTFLPVIVKPIPQYHTEPNDALVLALPAGRRLAVSAGFDRSTLKRLLDVLEERPWLVFRPPYGFSFRSFRSIFATVLMDLLN